MLTEQEAREKWCPMYRLTAAGGDRPEWHDNRGKDEGGLGEARCLGSACMFWRWPRVQPEASGPMPEGGYPMRGYCGMAGEPK